MSLGKAKNRHVTRMFFPRLYKKGKFGVTSEYRKVIYEQCIRPAVLAINRVDQSRWPVTYSAMTTLFRDTKGSFHFNSFDIPGKLVAGFGAKLLELLEEHDDLKDAFFVHELRGTKSSCHHNPGNADERKAAMEDVFDVFDTELFDPHQWVVDIGLEIQQEGRTLQWLTEGHQHILAYLLPLAPENLISAVLQSKTQYFCDISAQLGDLGGFRALPGSRGKLDMVSYINVYTTDKSVTYQLHKGIYRRRKPWHLFPVSISQLIKDMGTIGGVFQSCAADGIEGNARMEIRVPLGIADAVLTQLPYEVIHTAVVSFPCKTLW